MRPTGMANANFRFRPYGFGRGSFRGRGVSSQGVHRPVISIAKERIAIICRPHSEVVHHSSHSDLECRMCRIVSQLVKVSRHV